MSFVTWNINIHSCAKGNGHFIADYWNIHKYTRECLKGNRQFIPPLRPAGSSVWRDTLWAQSRTALHHHPENMCLTQPWKVFNLMQQFLPAGQNWCPLQKGCHLIDRQILSWQNKKRSSKFKEQENRNREPEKLLWINVSMEATLASHSAHGITWKSSRFQHFLWNWNPKGS